MGSRQKNWQKNGPIDSPTDWLIPEACLLCITSHDSLMTVPLGVNKL